MGRGLDVRLRLAGGDRAPENHGSSIVEAHLDTLVTIHSLVRWLVLVALVAGIVVAFGASRRPGEAFADPIFSGVAIVVDIQVTIGIILWIFNDGWSQSVFMAYIHPIAMLAALGVAHAAIGRGRKAAKRDHAGGNRIVAIGLVVALVLVIGAVPWERL